MRLLCLPILTLCPPACQPTTVRKDVAPAQHRQYSQALKASQRALTRAQNNEEKGWVYFHIAQIYYELRIERDAFDSIFQAVNNGAATAWWHGLAITGKFGGTPPFPKTKAPLTWIHPGKGQRRLRSPCLHG